jgi:hypothetical protein
MAIQPGNLTTTATDYTHFDDSMAERIEIELNLLLDKDDLPRLPTDEDDREVRDRRRLFVAVARAVVHHLNNRRASITVALPDDGSVSPEFDIDWG